MLSSVANNQSQQFHWTARYLHWSVVLLITLLYLTAYYRKWFTTQMEVENWYLIMLHMNLGVLIFLLTVLALVLRLFIPRPVDPQLPAWKRLAANCVQASLTGFLLLLPLVAYMGSGMKIALFNRYLIPNFASLEWGQWLINDYFGTLMISFTEPFGMMHRDWGRI